MAASNDQEPSIEEILASIREIISDDDAAAPAAKAGAASAPAPEPVAAPAVEEDDILDLGAFEAKPDPLAGVGLEMHEGVNVEFTDPLPEPEPEPEIQPAPVDEPEEEPEPILSSMANFGATATVPEPVADDGDSLLTDHAKSASMDSLTRLAQNIAISRAGQGGTLEDIVREMIRPMLRDWLDRNLPPMIEHMVERELERLVKESMNR